MARYSGLQREVLALYRKCLRESRRKPVVSNAQWNGGAIIDFFVKEARKHFEAFARYVKRSHCPSRILFQSSQDCLLMVYGCRTEFQKSIKLDKKDFGAIEYLLRKGQRQVEMYSSPGIKDIR
jgi:succinate dehydrogenase assembly factor 1